MAGNQVLDLRDVLGPAACSAALVQGVAVQPLQVRGGEEVVPADLVPVGQQELLEFELGLLVVAVPAQQPGAELAGWGNQGRGATPPMMAKKF